MNPEYNNEDRLLKEDPFDLSNAFAQIKPLDGPWSIDRNQNPTWDEVKEEFWKELVKEGKVKDFWKKRSWSSKETNETIQELEHLIQEKEKKENSLVQRVKTLEEQNEELQQIIKKLQDDMEILARTIRAMAARKTIET